MCVCVFHPQKLTALPVGLISFWNPGSLCRHRIKQQSAELRPTTPRRLRILKTHTFAFPPFLSVSFFLSFFPSSFLSGSPLLAPPLIWECLLFRYSSPPSAAAASTSTLAVLRECQTTVPDSFPSFSIPPSLPPSRCVYLLHAFCEECWQTLKMSFRKWV